MEIRPQDMGERWHIAVVRYRALGNARFSLPPNIGVLGRIWASGLDIPERVTAATLPLINDFTAPLVAGVGTGIILTALTICIFCQFALPVVIGSLFLGGAALFGCLIALPRRRFQRLHRMPVKKEELEALKGAHPEKREGQPPVRRSKNTLLKVMEGLRGIAPKAPGDELETEYLSFVQDVLSVRDVSPAAENEIKGVVHSMGEAVGALPDPMLENDAVVDIVGEAEALAAKSRQETDPVVAESLLRQAEAHLTRAHAVDNNRKLMRRTNFLREELVAQIKAVRSLLPSLSEESVSAATDYSRLVSVAATVQSIASEASSVAEARQELSLALYPRLAPVDVHQKETRSATVGQR